MKIEGKRIYSNEEIHQMAIVGFDTNFMEYLSNAPKRVKHIVENMLSSEQERNEIRTSYFINKETCMNYNTEYSGTLEENENVDDLEASSDGDERSFLGNVDNDKQKDNQSNPYMDMNFSDRLELNELRVTVVTDDKCYIHGNRFEEIQVVLKYDGGKRYSSYIQCCPKCKKLFIPQEELEELEIRLKDKKIQYLIEL